MLEGLVANQKVEELERRVEIIISSMKDFITDHPEGTALQLCKFVVGVDAINTASPDIALHVMMENPDMSEEEQIELHHDRMDEMVNGLEI